MAKMRKLTKREKETLSNIFNELCKCELFIGKYDAKHGNEHFMYGISTVMECLANMISNEMYDAFNDMFTKNMIESEKKVRESD